jgi:hypothetical protein
MPDFVAPFNQAVDRRPAETDSAAEPGESATFDFRVADLVSARARETTIGIEEGRAEKVPVEACGD